MGEHLDNQKLDKTIVAAFDFDGTLTLRDTMFPFLLYVVGGGAFIRHILALSPILTGYGLGIITNNIAKERLLAHFLSGMFVSTLKPLAVKFADEKLPGLQASEAISCFGWHKRQGHRCIVISASLELYVRPWAERLGFDDVIASTLETNDHGGITGKLLGGNCFGSEKVRRMEAMLGPKSGYTLYAYGDSRGDKELLSCADYAYYRQFPKNR